MSRLRWHAMLSTSDSASGDMTSRGPAVTVLVESLLQRGTEADIAEAAATIERLAAVPIDPGFVLHELPLLRLACAAGARSRR